MSEKKKFENITQAEIIMEYYLNNPNRDIRHPEIVDWATQEYKKRTGKEFRDPDRQIRKLYQDGKLIKVKKGVYKYDPNYQGENKNLNDFTAAQKAEILKKGKYKCAICGLGRADKVELHVDHIVPKERGGKNEISNGQVLCSRHNFLKDTFKQTETGKRFFINLYNTIKERKDVDESLMEFVLDVLRAYERHDINGHIEYDDKILKSKIKNKRKNN